VQVQARVFLVTVLVEVIDSLSIELRSTTFDAVHFVSLFKQ